MAYKKDRKLYSNHRSLITGHWLLIPALLWLAGCAGLGPAPPPRMALSPGEVLAQLQARQQSIRSFQAKGRITLISPEQNYSGTGLVAGRLPATLKADVLDFLGRSLLSFASDGQEVRVFIPREGKIFHGPASPRNLAAFIPPGVTLPQALRLLVGALPLNGGRPQRGEFHPAQGLYVYEWANAQGGLQERLWVDQELHPVKEEWYGEDGTPRFTAELAEYGSISPLLPGKITLRTDKPRVELRLAYKDLLPNPDLKPSDLALQPPPGVQEVPLKD
jgi:hypothetical protein